MNTKTMNTKTGAILLLAITAITTAFAVDNDPAKAIANLNAQRAQAGIGQAEIDAHHANGSPVSQALCLLNLMGVKGTANTKEHANGVSHCWRYPYVTVTFPNNAPAIPHQLAWTSAKGFYYE
ncbi:MAG: hypothetical protein IAE94_09610 [Chthoniobacterales bacterium]|nr:hypothetical protein [Chthoniobacterales bacterium]